MKKRKNKSKTILPKRLGLLYSLMALLLVPWIIYLSISLPTRNVNGHWDLSWVGLDVVIMSGLFLTGLFTKINSSWVVLSASSTASLLIIDAWFDIVSSKAGSQIEQSIALAILIEIPLSIYTFSIARRALKNIARKR